MAYESSGGETVGYFRHAQSKAPRRHQMIPLHTQRRNSRNDKPTACFLSPDAEAPTLVWTCEAHVRCLSCQAPFGLRPASCWLEASQRAPWTALDRRCALRPPGCRHCPLHGGRLVQDRGKWRAVIKAVPATFPIHSLSIQEVRVNKFLFLFLFRVARGVAEPHPTQTGVQRCERIRHSSTYFKRCS